MLHRTNRMIPDLRPVPQRPPVQTPRRAGLAVVPIRALGVEHRASLLRHLLALVPEDRYLRFGHAASDRQLRDYVQHIDFVRDELFGVFDRELELVAAAHLALAGAPGGEAEFGVSVRPDGRGRGLGTRLFERAATIARNRGLQILRLQCLSRNRAMIGIARRAGMSVRNRFDEAEATLRVPPRSLFSHLDEWLSDALGEVDFAIKQGRRRARTP